MKRIMTLLSLILVFSGLNGLTLEDQMTIKKFIGEFSPQEKQKILDGFFTSLDEELQLYSGKERLKRLVSNAGTGHDKDKMKSFTFEVTEAEKIAKDYKLPEDQVTIYTEVKSVGDKFRNFLADSEKGIKGIVLEAIKGAVQTKAHEPTFKVTQEFLENAASTPDTTKKLQAFQEKFKQSIQNLQQETENLKTKYHEKESADIDSFFKHLESEIMS